VKLGGRLTCRVIQKDENEEGIGGQIIRVRKGPKRME
jgi:hypothetical protein